MNRRQLLVAAAALPIAAAAPVFAAQPTPTFTPETVDVVRTDPLTIDSLEQAIVQWRLANRRIGAPPPVLVVHPRWRFMAARLLLEPTEIHHLRWMVWPLMPEPMQFALAPKWDARLLELT